MAFKSIRCARTKEHVRYIYIYMYIIKFAGPCAQRRVGILSGWSNGQRVLFSIDPGDPYFTSLNGRIRRPLSGDEACRIGIENWQTPKPQPRPNTLPGQSRFSKNGARGIRLRHIGFTALPEKQNQKIQGGNFERLGHFGEIYISNFEDFAEEVILYLSIFPKMVPGVLDWDIVDLWFCQRGRFRKSRGPLLDGHA